MSGNSESQFRRGFGECPWCGKPCFWRGLHAAREHPEEWEAFKLSDGEVV